MSEKAQLKPLGDVFGLLIGLYEGVDETYLDRDLMLKHLQMLIAEVKRLQDIEAERDRYKTAYEYASTNLVGYGLKIAAANAEKVSKGEQPNE